ncbi:MAG: metallophosphoesterase family protein [Deltaproteobacteria bacterium]|nr:metallophosphoesterase family protein [Deltaproteobacteria bacterium]
MKAVPFLLILVSSISARAETFGPYLGDVTRTSIKVAWRTEIPSNSVVEVAPAENGDFVAAGGTDQETLQHEVLLTGLDAGARYRYRVRSDTGGATVFESEPHHFRIDGGPGSPFRFVFFAEVHENSEVAGFDSVVRAFDPDFQIQPGDNVDEGSELAQWQNFFTRGDWYGDLPLFNVNGNHNYAGNGIDLSTEVLVNPGNEFYYSFRYGDVLFLGIDSEHLLNDEIRDNVPPWLEKVLTDATDGIEDPVFIIAFEHIPPWSSCTGSCALRKLVENPWVRDELVERFERFGVDLVLNGHDKIYERSLKEGVTYIQVNSGSGPYDVDPDAGFNPYSQVLVGDGLSMLRVAVQGCALRFEAVRPDGVVIDEGELTGRCGNLKSSDEVVIGDSDDAGIVEAGYFADHNGESAGGCSGASRSASSGPYTWILAGFLFPLLLLRSRTVFFGNILINKGDST